jgi:predicted nucleotidyltransferase
MANTMAISAIFLFGSRARGDHERGSDTDLLLVTAEDAPRHNTIGNLSTFLYPRKKLEADAASGDLFVCHLVREAKAVHDPLNQLQELRGQFRLRRSYAREIEQATDLGWFLDQHANLLNSRIVSRRMIWCVRTILIARSAERGTPIFAPAELARSTTSQAANGLLSDRHQHRPDAIMRKRFRQFLLEEATQPNVSNDWSITEFGTFFQATGNSVGEQTVRRGTEAVADDSLTY